jgi:hypothetical protein
MLNRHVTISDPRNEKVSPLASKIRQERLANNNNNTQNFNDDDDHEHDEEEEEEDCFDPKTGKQIITPNMSEERKRQALEKDQRELEALLHPTVDFHITPLRKYKSAAERRALSQQALQEARQDVAMALNKPCPIVHDPDSGFVMPRESIVTHAKPIEVFDEVSGETMMIAPPETGWVGTEDEIEIQKKRLLQQKTSSHRAASYEVLEQMRVKKLLRQMGDLSKDLA